MNHRWDDHPKRSSVQVCRFCQAQRRRTSKPNANGGQTSIYVYRRTPLHPWVARLVCTRPDTPAHRQWERAKEIQRHRISQARLIESKGTS